MSSPGRRRATSASRARASRPPFAAQLAAENAARKAQEHGVKKVDVFVKGPGSGRETAIRSLQAAGLEVGTISDVTPPAAQRLPSAQAASGLTGKE